MTDWSSSEYQAFGRENPDQMIALFKQAFAQGLRNQRAYQLPETPEGAFIAQCVKYFELSVS
jgi:hypothetical protein